MTTKENLERARAWIRWEQRNCEHDAACMECAIVALVAAVRAKGRACATMDLPGDTGDMHLGDLREMISEHAEDVPEVPA